MKSLNTEKPIQFQPKQPFARNRLLRDASWRAVYDCMKQDASIHVFGEGAEVKAHYDAPAIERDFIERVHTLPISEDGNTNFAIGTSLLGIKPVVDVISADFLYRTLDSICNTASKLNFVRPNEAPRTIVIRAEFFTGGPTTGQRPESLFTHIPGLRVVIPSTPRDAYGLMKTALETPGVTIYFEDREIADRGYFFEEDLQTGQSLGFGEAMYRKYGQRGTATIVTYGIMRQRVEALLQNEKRGDFYREPNYDCGIVDLRSLYPIDWQCIQYAVNRTRNLLIIEPDITYGGVGAEIAAHMAEVDRILKIKRLGAKRGTIPSAPGLHKYVMPTDEEVLGAIADLTKWR